MLDRFNVRVQQASPPQMLFSNEKRQVTQMLLLLYTLKSLVPDFLTPYPRDSPPFQETRIHHLDTVQIPVTERQGHTVCSHGQVLESWSG